MNIYVSTGGAGGVPAYRTALALADAGVTDVELSGGRHAPDLLSQLVGLRSRVSFQVHNYFPPPAEPFVLNLGSLDPAVAARSLAHVETALDLCTAVGADRYSFHAGFLIDPRVDELGKRIAQRVVADRERSIAAFVARVTRLDALAAERGVRLMVENNVLSARNHQEFGCNPLLMCDPDECARILGMLPERIGLLVDVAHLKVSARSLGFDPVRLFQACGPRIAGYHLSDNAGVEDSNDRFDDDSWFWPHLRPTVDYCSIEVYGESPAELARLVALTRGKLSIHPN